MPRPCLRGLIVILNRLRPGLALTVARTLPSTRNVTLAIATPVTETSNGPVTGEFGPHSAALPAGRVTFEALAAGRGAIGVAAIGVVGVGVGVCVGVSAIGVGAGVGVGVGVGVVPPPEAGGALPEPAEHVDRVIVFVSRLTALERRVRIRPRTVAPVSRTLAPSDIVVPWNALSEPSVTPCVASDSCQ